MGEWTELERTLEGLLAAGNVEVHEDGEWLPEFTGLRYELRAAGKAPLIHLWSGERNLVRRILRVAECSPGQVVLEVQRFGRSKPGRLELVRADTPRPAGRLAREKFRARFRRMLTERFPDARVDSLTTAPDLEHSFSGRYPRGLLVEQGRGWAVLAASAQEDAAAVDGALGFGLIWLDAARQRAERRAVEGLRLFLPEGASGVTRHRLTGIVPSAHIELYEFDEARARAERVEASDAGNLGSWLTPRREVEGTLAAAREAVERIRALSPPAMDAIDAVVSPGTREVALRFRGLEFARWDQGQVLFGLGDERRTLEAETWPELEEIVRELAERRRAATEELHHTLYRAAAERWLETKLFADPTCLDAQLDARHLYSQVPALSAGDRGVIDLLGVTRAGRLVVIELKASEDLQLPLQALDYWLRVRRHHAQGDFPRYGYFTGVELDPRPPLMWLAAPGLRFHPMTDVLLRYLAPEVQVTRVGLNEGWRHKVQVLFRM